MSAYKNFIRPFHLEEPLDFMFYRPVAYGVIKTLERFPMTPNLFSLLALVCAWGADIGIVLDQPLTMMLAGFGILFFSVLDCCDGMWARWKGNNYPYGDLVDMFIDLLAAVGHIAALVFLTLGRDGNILLPLASGIMLFVHASLFHDRKAVWTALTQNQPDERAATVRKYRAELSRLRQEKSRRFSRFLIVCFLMFSSVQSAERVLPSIDTEKLKKALPWWGIAAGTTHLTILALALIFNRPEIYYSFALIVANIFVVIAWFKERN